MATRKLAGWAASSETPENVSARIKGVILACSSIIIFIAASFFHITLGANDVLSLATMASTIGGLVWSLYGAGVALVGWIATIKPTE